MRLNSTILISMVTLSQVLNAAEAWWPQFRGPNCSGVSETSKIPAQFGSEDSQLWKVTVPGGMSSPVVWRDQIFLTAYDSGKFEVRCHDLRRGSVLWSRIITADQIEEFHSSEGSPAASSCVTDGRRVVSYFGSFGLVCHDFMGRELWRHRLPMAVTAGGFGTGSSPTLSGGLVLLNRDMLNGCSLLAVNIKTGEKVWETARPDVSQSYGSTMIWRHDGKEEIVMSGSLKLKAYDPKTGKENWSLAGMPSFTCTTTVAGDGLLFFAGWSPGKGDAPMPTFEQTASSFDKNKDNAITPDEAKGTPLESFFSAQDMNRDGKITAEDINNMRSMMAKGENSLVAVRPGGKGELNESYVAWKQTRGLPYVPSPLYYRGNVYLVKDGGMVSCFNAQTGAVQYQQERINALGNYYASPVAADGKIIVCSLDGKMSVIEAGGETPKVLHQIDFKERVSATPALVKDRVIVRTATSLIAFGNR